MSGQIGITETEDALVAIMQLGLVLWKSFHDGFQVSDMAELWDAYKNDPELSNALKEAYEGYQSIPAEIKDISMDEVMVLSGVMLKYLPKYLHVVK